MTSGISLKGICTEFRLYIMFYTCDLFIMDGNQISQKNMQSPLLCYRCSNPGNQLNIGQLLSLIV